jgi:excisionase family DNA binding protein
VLHTMPASQVSPYDVPWLSIATTAQMVGISQKTVRRAIAEGRLPASRVGRLIRIRRDDVDALYVPIPAAGSR